MEEELLIDGINYKNIAPIMTSNTTPSPYVASASSEYEQRQGAFTCLDRTTISTFAFYNNPVGWIAYDLAIEREISFVRMIGRVDYINSNPKDFDIDISSNGTVWNTVKTNTITDWNNPINIIFDSPITTRYIRFNIKSNNTFSNTGVGKIGFFEKVKETEYVSHTKAFHAQTLPMSTTAKILTKTNDSREGLLGMANDDKNYGDLYVVGRDGKAHLTKSATKSEILFQGLANSVNTFSLGSPMNNNYKYIMIRTADSASSIRDESVSIVPAEINRAALVSGYDTRHLGITFISETQFKITSRSYLDLLEIIGIY